MTDLTLVYYEDEEAMVVHIPAGTYTEHMEPNKAAVYLGFPELRAQLIARAEQAATAVDTDAWGFNRGGKS